MGRAAACVACFCNPFQINHNPRSCNGQRIFLFEAKICSRSLPLKLSHPTARDILSILFQRIATKAIFCRSRTSASRIWTSSISSKDSAHCESLYQVYTQQFLEDTFFNTSDALLMQLVVSYYKTPKSTTDRSNCLVHHQPKVLNNTAQMKLGQILFAISIQISGRVTRASGYPAFLLTYSTGHLHSSYLQEVNSYNLYATKSG